MYQRNASVSFVNSCIFYVNTSLTAVRRFGDLKQHCSSLQIPDLETCEINVEDVVFRFAQIVCDVKKVASSF